MFGEPDLLSGSHLIYVLSVISDPINANYKVLAKRCNTPVFLLCSLRTPKSCYFHVALNSALIFSVL